MSQGFYLLPQTLKIKKGREACPERLAMSEVESSRWESLLRHLRKGSFDNCLFH